MSASVPEMLTLVDPERMRRAQQEIDASAIKQSTALNPTKLATDAEVGRIAKERKLREAQLVNGLGESKPTTEPVVLSSNSFVSFREEKRTWPKDLADEAYQGLVGKIVAAIEPETESDPAALVLQFLAAFGAMVGRGPHVRVEGDEHHSNLDVLIVGATSKARKGTSWGRILQLLKRLSGNSVNPQPGGWPTVVDGLSSGEGLKYAVRDARYEMPVGKKAECNEEVMVDAGVPDKRLLVVEAEFSQVLRQGARAGNTLSATIRSAWDGSTLMSITKNDPVRATGAHIAIIGHITVDELRAELTATDSANGFANRFIMMCVKRSKPLPFGGAPLTEEVLADLEGDLRDAVAHARRQASVKMTEAAREIWQRNYAVLSEGHTGLLGAVTARAEAQCLRLALIYALADCATAIDAPHLKAAIAVWERAEESARFIFGSALGDRVADEILRAVRSAGTAGMTRTAISTLFNRNEKTECIGTALQRLSDQRLIERKHDQHQGGRPPEIWMAT
ncbi:MAG TPA: hypothetical protein VK130_04730 [Steroidobacteraceae bacterium]|nr:hypothetical protein [Steroidobacteraceae bacterium]